MHTGDHSTPRVQSQTSFPFSLLPQESQPVPRLRPSVCWQTPVYIQFTPVGTPDPPISLLLTASFRCPIDITNVRYPKPGPHPPLTPNVLLQKFSLVQEEAAPFPQLLGPSPLTPLLLSYPMSSLPILASHSSAAIPGIRWGSRCPLCSLDPLQFTVSTAAPLHVLSSSHGTRPVRFLRTLLIIYSPQRKECSMKARLFLCFISCCVPAPRTGPRTSSKWYHDCVCGAPLHLLIASSLSWGLSPMSWNAGSTQN